MKRIKEQTYYEILEVSPGATAKEIQRAYEHAKETFHSDSLAIYSLFSEQEIKGIQIGIEEAYRGLLDEALQRSNDQSLPRSSDDRPLEFDGNLRETEEEVKETKAAKDIKEVKDTKETRTNFPPSTEHPIDLGDSLYRGKRLKLIRERMGIDLKAVSMDTKINAKILRLIEDETFEKLPPLVYLKGFLKAYAHSLGLDSEKVVEGYLQVLNKSKKR